MRPLVKLAVLILILGSLGCRPTSESNSQVQDAERELKAYAAAKEDGDYPNALRHAQKAIAFAPKMVAAHFAAATSADGMCRPNGETSPGLNERVCGLAVQEYQKVLDQDPAHEDSLMSLAYLLYSFNRVDESERLYRKALVLQPNDPSALSAVAAVNLSSAGKDIYTVRARFHLSPKEPLIQHPACVELRRCTLPRLDEGIALVTRALEVNGDNGEVMIFLSTLYALRAEVQCGNRSAYQSDTRAAKKWNRRQDDLQEKDEPQAYKLRRCPPAPPPLPFQE